MYHSLCWKHVISFLCRTVSFQNIFTFDVFVWLDHYYKNYILAINLHLNKNIRNIVKIYIFGATIQNKQKEEKKKTLFKKFMYLCKNVYWYTVHCRNTLFSYG